MRLALLWWKDWQSKRLHITGPILLYLLPALFSIVYGFLCKGDYSALHHEEYLVSHQLTSFNYPPGFQPPFHIHIFFPASANGTEFIEFKNFCGALCAGYSLTLYKDSTMLHPDVDDIAFVVIEEWNVTKPSLKYKYIDFRWRIQSILSPLWGLWSLDQKAPLRREGENLAAITQKLLDMHFYRRRECLIRNVTCSKNTGPVTFTHSALPLFNPSTASTVCSFGQMSTVISLMGVWHLAKQMAEERQAGAKILLKGLGVGRLEYFGSFFLLYYVKYTWMQLILWIPANCLLKNAFEISVIYPGILIYSAVLSSFSVLMAVIFHDDYSVKLGSSLIVFFLHLGQFGQEDKAGMTDAFFSASMLFPNAYYYYLRSSATRRDVGFATKYMILPLVQIPFLLVSAILMFFLAIFFDYLYPGDEQRGMTPRDVIMRLFWRNSQPLYEEQNFMKQMILFGDVEDSSISEDKPSMKESVANKYSRKAPKEKICVVQLEGVCLSVGKTWIINRITMKVFYNEITVLYGPREAGEKLLDLISGEERPNYGEVIMTMKGLKLAVAKRPTFIPWLTVTEMITIVTKWRGGVVADSLQMINELSPVLAGESTVSSLNAAQKQQLNLLLAFAGNPDIVLLDEPTAHCSPGIRDLMHAFIMSHKEGKTIIISTYNPLEAEVADVVAFLSRGHLITLGSLNEIRLKFVKSLYIIVWPTEKFSKEQTILIEKLINAQIPSDLPRASRELMPNYSLRFEVPISLIIHIQEVLVILEKIRDELGITYLEIQRQNVQDAYRNCLSIWEEDKEINPKTLTLPLTDHYAALKTSSIWPELDCVFQMNLSFARNNWLYYIIYHIVPILFIGLFAFTGIRYNLIEEELKIGLEMLEYGLIGGAQIYTNIPLRNKGSQAVTTMMTDKEALLAGELLYNEPPIVAGVVKENNVYHLYSMKLLRFGTLLTQNLFINSIIDSTSNNQIVHMWIESRESAKLTRASLVNDSFLRKINRRDMVNIFMRQWVVLLVLSGVLAVGLARSTLLISKLASDNCIRMYYLMGARPFFFWLAIIVMDAFVFLLALIGCICLLLVFSPLNTVGLVMAVILCLLAFISTLPTVYLLALYCKDIFRGYASTFGFICFVSILPACFSFFVIQYEAVLEEWTQFTICLAFFCPPLAASVASAIFSDLIINQQISAGEAIEVIRPLFLACIIHCWTWLLLVAYNKVAFQRFLTRTIFWWKELKMKPKDKVVSRNISVSVITTKTKGISRMVKEENVGDLLTEEVEAAGGKTKEAGQLNMIAMTTSQSPMENSHKEKATVNYELVMMDHYADSTNKITFDVQKQQVVYLFGDLPRNRSSLLDMAAGQSHPIKGRVTVKGKAPEYNTGIGYVPIDSRLCGFLTGRQTLEMVTRLKKYQDPRQFVEFLLLLTELEDMADRLVDDYSSSDRRMLQFAITIIDRPTVLIIDEIDCYVSPLRMKAVWATIDLLRNNFQVPVLYSSSRAWEQEATSSHTAMLFHGAVSLFATTVTIKKRFFSLATLTVTLPKRLDVETVKSVISGTLDCEMRPHSHPNTYIFLMSIKTGKYVETLTRVSDLMTSIGVVDWHLDMPDLSSIYHANFTSYNPLPQDAAAVVSF